MNLPPSITTVTKFSKFLAGILFFIFILVGFYAGMQYQKNIGFFNPSTTSTQRDANGSGSKTITITLAKTFLTVHAKAGDTITTNFGSNHSWKIYSSDQSVVSVTSPHDAKATSKGTAILSASISPVCNFHMICPMFMLGFKTTIIVN